MYVACGSAVAVEFEYNDGAFPTRAKNYTASSVLGRDDLRVGFIWWKKLTSARSLSPATTAERGGRGDGTVRGPRRAEEYASLALSMHRRKISAP